MTVLEMMQQDKDSVVGLDVSYEFGGSKPIIGQVWKDESTKVKVGCLGRVSKNGEESIAFIDVDTDELKTWMLKTFLAKFERVS